MSEFCPENVNRYDASGASSKDSFPPPPAPVLAQEWTFVDERDYAVLMCGGKEMGVVYAQNGLPAEAAEDIARNINFCLREGEKEGIK